MFASTENPLDLRPVPRFTNHLHVVPLQALDENLRLHQPRFAEQRAFQSWVKAKFTPVVPLSRWLPRQPWLEL